MQAAVDAWDPERRARAVSYIVLSDPERAAGRPWYARRLPAWARFEDKTRLHPFLDQIGVRRGPAAEAAEMFTDLSPPQSAGPRTEDTATARREAGAGRPTKRERREIDALRRSGS